MPACVPAYACDASRTKRLRRISRVDGGPGGLNLRRICRIDPKRQRLARFGLASHREEEVTMEQVAHARLQRLPEPAEAGVARASGRDRDLGASAGKLAQRVAAARQFQSHAVARAGARTTALPRRPPARRESTRTAARFQPRDDSPPTLRAWPTQISCVREMPRRILTSVNMRQIFACSPVRPGLW